MPQISRPGYTDILPWEQTDLGWGQKVKYHYIFSRAWDLRLRAIECVLVYEKILPSD